MPSLSSTLTFLGFAALVAANCNPSYDVAGYGDCTKQCKVNAGRELYADWTDDPTSPNFIESLKYKCERGFPAYTTFMTVSGSCLMSCSKAEQEDYAREHAESCAWYAEHKEDTCAEESGDSEPSASESGDAEPSASETGSASPTTGGDADETSPAGGNGGNGGSNGSGSGDADGDDTDADSQEDGESAATKLQLGGLVAAAVAAGSALLL